jgi:deoxyribodipyrimidine photolyase-related protein
MEVEFNKRMSQFEDVVPICSKPYISGSNYLMKTSNNKKDTWQKVWDGLFWRFMHRHHAFFLSKPLLRMLVLMFDKMPEETQ